ncbi:hypothetical protein OPIT5_02070 [Opitutaceae bacterium TAV5]|nr:hypothetical protein OPIT5_02070 [Opitutaceae bacterium TAV5]
MNTMLVPGCRYHALVRFSGHFRQCLVCAITLLAVVFICTRSHADTIGYWRFEEGKVTADSSGNNLTLSLLGSSYGGSSFGYAIDRNDPGSPGYAFPASIDGNANAGALKKTGRGYYYGVNDSPAFTLTNAITVEAFVNRADATAATIASRRGNTAGGTSWSFLVGSSGTLLFQYQSQQGGAWGSTSSTWESLDSGLSITAGHDYYVAFAMDLLDKTSAGATFYVQDLTAGTGMQTASVAHSFTTIGNTNQRFTIGDTSTQGTGDAWNGAIDEVRLSNSRLGQGELLISQIPEPAAVSALVGAGVLAAGIAMRRRRSAGR